MDIKSLLLIAALGSSGDPINPRYAPFLRDGCVDGPPIPVLDSDEGIPADPLPRLEDMPMSGESLRFIITPDSFRGDGLLMMQIDSGKRRSLDADGKPFVLATVGTWRRTCTRRMSVDACPEAIAVRERLQQLQIPIGHGFGEPMRITLHATRYQLQFHGNGFNKLSYWEPDNPLQEALESAKAALRTCWQPAFDAVMAP